MAIRLCIFEKLLIALSTFLIVNYRIDAIPLMVHFVDKTYMKLTSRTDNKMECSKFWTADVYTEKREYIY